MVVPSTIFDHQIKVNEPIMGYEEFWKEPRYASLEYQLKMVVNLQIYRTKLRQYPKQQGT
jgi:hypothetical protein